MPGKRRGLVAPQNTFLDSIVRKTTALRMSFLLASARIIDHPVVFVSNEFATMVGYSKTEVLGKSCLCTYLHGQLTDLTAIDRVKEACDTHQFLQLEIILYKRNLSPIWLRINVVPVRDENSQVIMLLIAFKDTTYTKQAFDTDEAKGLGKFARLARSIAKNRSTNLNMSLGSSVFKESWATSSGNQHVHLRDDAAQKIFENLRQYKQEPPKTPPFIILHYSTFKTTWDWFILLLTFYTAVMVPANVAFHNKSLDNVPMIIVDSFVDMIFFVDVLFSFHTTVVGKSREVIADPRAIRAKYVKTWFVIDILSCLPYDAFHTMKSHGSTGSTVFNALKVLRLLRLGRIARKLDHYLEYGAAVLILLVLVYILIAHWMACIWYSLGLMEAREGVNYGWLSSLSRMVEQPINMTANVSRQSDADARHSDGDSRHSDNDAAGEFPKLMSYVTALYFTLSCITSVGFGNVSANTEMEKVFTICGMLLGSLLYATIFGNITTIFQQLYSATAKYQEMLSNAREFMRLNEVPGDLSNRVIDYIVSRWSMTKGVDPAAVLAYCPKDMKADICVHLSRKIFDANPAFRLASEGCLRAIAVHLITNHTAPSDIIIRQGEIIDHLFFVVSGTLEVTHDDQIVALLHKGDVFGDPFWDDATLAASTVTVKTLTYANIHHIKREKLREVLSFHTAFAKSFARNMVLSYDLRRKFEFARIPDHTLHSASSSSDHLNTKASVVMKNLVQRFRRFSQSHIPPGSLLNITALSTARSRSASNLDSPEGGEKQPKRTSSQEKEKDLLCDSLEPTMTGTRSNVNLLPSIRSRGSFMSVQIPTIITEAEEDQTSCNGDLIHFTSDVKSPNKFEKSDSFPADDVHSTPNVSRRRRLLDKYNSSSLSRHSEDTERYSVDPVSLGGDVLRSSTDQSEVIERHSNCKAAFDIQIEIQTTLKKLVSEVNDLNVSMRHDIDNLNQRLSNTEAQLVNLHAIIISRKFANTASTSNSNSNQPVKGKPTATNPTNASAANKGRTNNELRMNSLNSAVGPTTASERRRMLLVCHNSAHYFPKASIERSSSSSLNLDVDDEQSNNTEATVSEGEFI